MGIFAAVRAEALTYQSGPDTRLGLGYINSALGLKPGFLAA
jgi:hypothetical protein